MNSDLLSYTVRRKPVKYTRISVKPPHGEIVVTAPPMVPDRLIRKFVEDKADWIAKHRERIARMPQRLQPGPEAERLRREMRAAVPSLLAYWAEQMGVEVPRFSIRLMTTRWGSCNPLKSHITLNLELARRDPELLEYVIVHELAHLIELGHGPRFTAVMDRHLPDWKVKRKLLNGV